MVCKKNCAITLFTDSNYLFAAGNLLIGILRYNFFIDDIIIFYSELSDDQIGAFTRISNKIIFREYSEDFFLSRIGDIKNCSSFLKRWTHGVFAKFEIFDSLKYYKHIIWLDVDMLVQGDFSSILQYSPLAFRKGGGYSIVEYCRTAGIKVPPNIVSPNGGLIYVEESIQQNFTSSYVYKIATECINKNIPEGYDEIPIALAAYENGIEPKLLGHEYNCVPMYSNKDRDAFIIHSASKRKFWNSKIYYNAFPEWKINNKIYTVTTGLSSPDCSKLNLDLYSTLNKESLLSCIPKMFCLDSTNRLMYEFVRDSVFIYPTSSKLFYYQITLCPDESKVRISIKLLENVKSIEAVVRKVFDELACFGFAYRNDGDCNEIYVETPKNNIRGYIDIMHKKCLALIDSVQFICNRIPKNSIHTFHHTYIGYDIEKNILIHKGLYNDEVKFVVEYEISDGTIYFLCKSKYITFTQSCKCSLGVGKKGFNILQHDNNKFILSCEFGNLSAKKNGRMTFSSNKDEWENFELFHSPQ